ncbi:MAG: PAS domain S-box protein [Balneolaceae bacterium]|nr:PAS domain S-box protein [Balneolaceae bacterium]
MQELLTLSHLKILNSIQHGILVINSDGIIEYWNPACERIFGYKHYEIVGKSIRVLCDCKMPFKCLLERCSHDDKHNERWRGKCKDGSRIWLNVRSKTTFDEDLKNQYCVISLNSIEKLEIAKRNLKQIKALEETILETSVDAIITTNKRGDILSFNPAAVEMFGYQKEEVIGKKVHLLIPSFYSENQDLFLKRFTGLDDTITKGGKIDFKGLRKDGTIFHINLSVSEVPWKGERMFLGIIRDLSQKRELEKTVLDIANEERRRIGRDLHDGLGQMLTGTRMVAENLARKLKANEVPGADEVQEISEMINDADEYARTLSRGLVQVDLEKMGLCVALGNLANRIPKMYNINCSYTESGQVEFENPYMALHIYRIVQEAVNNAVRHAEAKAILIRLAKNKLHTSVTIEDDGKGFDPNSVQKGGSGIQIMKYRAEMLGGILDISRTEDETTRVQCIIPNNLEHFNEPGDIGR